MKPYYPGEIKFKRDTSFRKQFFVPDSFAHPAKMDAQLLIWIVEHYTKPGEAILDPMAGSGTTMLACGLGRHCILIELEEKFCKMMRDNWDEVKMRPQLGYEMGDCQIIQGDARQLGGLLVDKIISSPPYSDMSMGGGLNTKPPREGTRDQSGRSPKSPSQKGAGGYVDKCIFSPPYAEAQLNKTAVTDKYPELKGKGGGLLTGLYKGHGDSEGNISNLPYGSIDKIVTSPPYAEGAKGPSRDPLWDRLAKDPSSARYGRKQHPSIGEGYSESKDNLGNLPYGNIDAVVTSPPYEESVHSTGQSAERVKALGSKYSNGSQAVSMEHGYSENKNNIGNLKSQSYLEAMLQVYAQCWGVLKDGGLMILVTKNFIRNKQIVRLDTDTIKLCEQAGFTCLERHYRKLPSQSFWRVIYHQKHPEVEQINHEDILVFQKQMVMELDRR